MSLVTRVLSVCAAVALPVAVASAQDIGLYAGTQVNYYTTGTFAGSGTGTGTFGALTLTFLPVGTAGTPATADPNPFTFASFGAIQAATSSSTLQPVSGNFTLNIFQTVPTGGSGSLVGTLAGSLDVNTSQATLTFASNTVTIGGVAYSLQNTTYALVPPTTNNGITTLQGRIEVQSTVPEPSTYALLATGFVALGGVAARRKRSAR